MRDPNAARPTEPYRTPTYDEQSARSERGLAGDLSALVEAVKQHWGKPAASERPFRSVELTADLVGQHCIRRPMNCLGDNQDED